MFEMDLEKELKKEHSKAQAQKIANWAVSSKENLDAFIDVFLNSHYRINQRAAWSLGIIGKEHPEKIKPYMGLLIENLRKEPIHDAVKRNTVRFLQDVKIPEIHRGTLADICFSFLADPKEPVAIKVFSMSALLNITKEHPELKNELKLLIEEQFEDGTAGFKSRGAKVLKALEKIN